MGGPQVAEVQAGAARPFIGDGALLLALLPAARLALLPAVGGFDA